MQSVHPSSLRTQKPSKVEWIGPRHRPGDFMGGGRDTLRMVGLMGSGERRSGRCMTSVRRSDRPQRLSSGLDTRRGPFELGIQLERGTVDGRLQTIASVRTTA